MENKKKKSLGALLLASGIGERLNSNLPKQFLKVGNLSILEITLNKFINFNAFSVITVVINKAHKTYLINIKKKYKNIKFIHGGNNRQESSYYGLLFMHKKTSVKKVVIHDIVRPNLNDKILKDVCSKLNKYNAIIPVIKVSDSIKTVKNKFIDKDVDRKSFVFSQTPQAFDLEQLLKSYKKIKKANLINYTDDAQIYINNNERVYTIKGDENNYKITNYKDFEYFKLINEEKQMICVGQGFDVHGFKKGSQITLFGIKIPFNKSLEGHSDADVGVHSIIDAILGGLSLGDIGKLFPDSKNKYKNIDSIILLKKVYELTSKANAKILHLDNTIICEKPKIQKYIPLMRKKISTILEININSVSIKATTTEKLGFLGREEGIASSSIITLKKNKYNA